MTSPTAPWPAPRPTSRFGRGATLALLLIGHAAWALPWQFELRDANGAPAAGAVVAVEWNGQAKAARGTRAEMVQRDRQFVPSVLVVQTGTAVVFPNQDTVRHHVYSFSPIKPFDLKLYAGTPAEPVRFDQAGVATLGCNIHDRMSAHIIVVDTPVFGQTDAQGRLALDLPAGEHVLRIWQERWGSRWWTQTLTVRPDVEPRSALQLPARP